ncbi:MAG: hypothetical protein ACXWHF_02770 [Chthoniobacterales bacterium]
MLNSAFKYSIRDTMGALALAALFCLTTTTNLVAQEVLYGGLGGHNNGDSTNDGALGIVSQTTGIVSIVGHPAGVSRISGLVFAAPDVLYGTTLNPPGGFPPPSGPRTSNLININVNTGALITSVPITSSGLSLAIADLAIQPGTGTLFGITNPDGPSTGPGLLYTINKFTGVATLIGNTGNFFGTLAFAPDGKLYMSAADLDFSTGNIINISLKTIDPNTGATLTSVPTRDFFGALAIRSDSTIFGGTGDQHQLFTINPLTGFETLIGDTGRNFIGDLAFQPVPESGPTFALMLFGFLSLCGLSRIWRSSRV